MSKTVNEIIETYDWVEQQEVEDQELGHEYEHGICDDCCSEIHGYDKTFKSVKRAPAAYEYYCEKHWANLFHHMMVGGTPCEPFKVQ